MERKVFGERGMNLQVRAATRLDDFSHNSRDLKLG